MYAFSLMAASCGTGCFVRKYEGDKDDTAKEHTTTTDGTPRISFLKREGRKRALTWCAAGAHAFNPGLKERRDSAG